MVSTSGRATISSFILLCSFGIAAGVRSNFEGSHKEELSVDDDDCGSEKNPDCNGLSGKCCPAVNSHGKEVMLACCPKSDKPKPKPDVVDGPGDKPLVPRPGGSGQYDGPVMLHFYAYRAVKGQWDATAVSWGTFGMIAASANLANAAGVLRYIHNEVVGVKVAANAHPPKCERKNGIDRIARYKVWMHNTQEVYDVKSGQFAPFVAMDNEMCSVPNCKEKMWDKYGYVVGCQKGDADYPGAVWYSFPGRCPSMKTGNKTFSCVMNEPGGSCYSPSGSRTCTYHYERDGEVMLDELSGINDYKEFCMDGGVEFNGPRDGDEGVTVDFWKGYQNHERNQQRTQALTDLFAKKYGSLNKAFVEEPPCDAFR